METTYRLLNFHSKIIEDTFKELGWEKNMNELEKSTDLNVLWMSRQYLICFIYHFRNILIGINRSLVNEISFLNRIQNLEDVASQIGLRENIFSFTERVYHITKEY